MDCKGGKTAAEAEKGRETTLVGGNKVILGPISRQESRFNPSVLEYEPQEEDWMTYYGTTLKEACDQSLLQYHSVTKRTNDYFFPMATSR